MAADSGLMARLNELVSLFNRKSLDLPHGLFDRRTQFLLNGTPFEAMLGRPASDPLVLMIARGPAGYRFAIKALQHAVPDARVELGTVEQGEYGTRSTEHAPSAMVVPLWLSGHLRGSGAPLEAVFRISVEATDDGAVTRADARVDPAVLDPIREARLRD